MADWESLRRPYVPSAEVVKAVCAELGAHYAERGGKYTKSNRQLKFKLELVRCEIGFNSSHSNMAGEWVNLEIVTSVFAADTDGMERKGILNAGFRPENFNIAKIDGELFAEITAYIDGCLERVKTFETAEGAAALTDEKISRGNPNNSAYFARYFGKTP